MKTCPACLLCGLFVASPALAADWSLTAGYGTARLNAGQAGTISLLTQDVSGSVNTSRLSLDCALTANVCIAAAYFDFSSLTTIHQLDPNGPETLVAVPNRYRRHVRALAFGPNLIWRPAQYWSVKAGVGAVISDYRTTATVADTGQNKWRSDSSGNLGWLGSVEASLDLTQTVLAGVAVRYFAFRRKIASSSALTARQVDVFLTVHL